MNSEFRNFVLSLENSKREVRPAEESGRASVLCTAWACNLKCSEGLMESIQSADEDVSFVELLESLL
jgi:hypothetical protein